MVDLIVLVFPSLILIFVYDQLIVAFLMNDSISAGSIIWTILNYWVFGICILSSLIILTMIRKDRIVLALLFPLLFFSIGHFSYQHLSPIQYSPGCVLHRLEVFEGFKVLPYLVTCSWSVCLLILTTHRIKVFAQGVWNRHLGSKNVRETMQKHHLKP